MRGCPAYGAEAAVEEAQKEPGGRGARLPHKQATMLNTT